MTSCHTSLADISIRHSNQDAAVHLAEEPAMDSTLKRSYDSSKDGNQSHYKMTSVQGGLLRLQLGRLMLNSSASQPQHHWLNPYQLSTVNQQTPCDIQIIPNLMPLAQNSFQQIHYRLSLYIPSLAVACFHKICDARRSFPKIFNQNNFSLHFQPSFMPWNIPGESFNGWGLGLTQSVVEGPWLKQ